MKPEKIFLFFFKAMDVLSIDVLEATCLELLESVRAMKRSGTRSVDVSLVNDARHLRSAVEEARHQVVEEEEEEVAVAFPSPLQLQDQWGRLPKNKRVGEEATEEPHKRNATVVARQVSGVGGVGQAEDASSLSRERIKPGTCCRFEGGDLVFFGGVMGSKKDTFLCSVFGDDTPKEVSRRRLKESKFDVLSAAEQSWVCRQLSLLFSSQIGKAVQRFSGLTVVQSLGGFCSNLTTKSLLLKGQSEIQAADKEILANLQLLSVGAEAAVLCRNSACFMVAAKLHEELKTLIGRGALTATFRKKLTELRALYEMELQVGTMERNLAAGRLMLKCWPLAFVGVTLLLDQQKVAERVVMCDNLRSELLQVVGGLDKVEKNVPTDNPVARELMHLAMMAQDAEAKESWVTDTMRAGDFAPLLCPLLSRSCDTIEFFEMDIMDYLQRGSETRRELNMACLKAYAKLLQENGVSVEICTSFEKPDFFAQVSANYLIGVLDGAVFLILTESRTILCGSHLSTDEQLRLSCLDCAFAACDMSLTSNHDQGICVLCTLVQTLHGANLNHDVLKVQIAYELRSQKLLPRNVSFLDWIGKHQRIRSLAGPLNSSSISVTVIEQRLVSLGFVIVKNFFSADFVTGEQVIELQSLVRESKSSEYMLLSERLAALKNASSKALSVLLEEMENRIQLLFPNRMVRDSVAFLSVAGSGLLRPHTDYTPSELQDLPDDGLCRGLPLVAVVAVQGSTLFDVWPGAVSWEQTEFFEHVEVSLNTGDVCFFLGSAVHAEAAHNVDNVSIHMNVESREMPCKLVRDESHFMDSNVGVVTILPRGVSLASCNNFFKKTLS